MSASADNVRAYREALAIARAGWVTVAELLRQHDPGGPLRESLKMIELIDGLDAAAVESVIYQRWLQGEELCPRADCPLPWCERLPSQGWAPDDCDGCELGKAAEREREREP